MKQYTVYHVTANARQSGDIHSREQRGNENGGTFCMVLQVKMTVCINQVPTSCLCVPSALLCKVPLSNSIHGPRPHNVLSAWFELLKGFHCGIRVSI